MPAVTTTDNRSLEKGFTLIELSIVLVLVGLLIGGILKGQELIEGARLKTTVAQWDAVKAAINTFQDKYAALPGDFAQASNFIPNVQATENGNGNGAVGAQITGGNSYRAALTGAAYNENRFFWLHLARADMIAGTNSAGNALPGKVSGSAYTALYGTMEAGAATARTSHWLRLERGGTTPASYTAGLQDADNVLEPTSAREIDTKYDDGIPNSGTVRANAAGGGTPDCRTAATPPQYNGTETANACVMMMDLL